MSLIAIIISLVVERFLGSMEEFRRYGWFSRYAAWLRDFFSTMPPLAGPAGVVLTLLLPLALTAAVDAYLEQWWVVLHLAFSVLVLLFCFGPTDLEAEVEAYVDAQERGDEESACWHAAELLGDTTPEHSGLLNRQIVENILVEANERLLAVLFWFLLLGPTGALMYRLASLLARDAASQDVTPLGEAALRLHAILAWLPARMCALAYALAGSFVDALHAWRQQEGRWYETTPAVLIATGLGALGYEDGEEELSGEHDTSMVHETLSLIRRAVLVVLGIVALSTLAGWMS
jgi:membrane protein required for beta-lactamase induction